MSKSTIRENYNSKFSLVSWLVRIILYGSVFASVFLPSYVAIEYLPGCPASKYYNSKHWLGRTLQPACGNPIITRGNVSAISRAQLAYHLERQKFADSIAELELGEVKAETSSYSCRIVQPMRPLEYLSQSANYDWQESMRMAICQREIKENKYENYLGVAYILPQTSAAGETETIHRYAICEMTDTNPYPTIMFKLINGEMQCPKGSIKIN